jgi:hypothetical protein
MWGGYVGRGWKKLSVYGKMLSKMQFYGLTTLSTLLINLRRAGRNQMRKLFDIYFAAIYAKQFQN